jgi:hypothetical protein
MPHRRRMCACGRQRHRTLEGKAVAVLFTDNDDFYGGKRREQDPVYALSAHAIDLLGIAWQYRWGAGL